MGRYAILNQVDREGLDVKVTTEERHEEGEEASHDDIGGRVFKFLEVAAAGMIQKHQRHKERSQWAAGS